MTTKEAIEGIKARIADIDTILEMDFRNIVNHVRIDNSMIQDGKNKIYVYADCVCSLQENIDEMRAKLGARFALENVLAMLEGKDVNNR